MVKKIVMMVICLVFMTGVYAQDKKFTFGVKAGLNIANYMGKDAKDTKMKIGYNVGVVSEYRLSEKFAVGPELLFSAQGASQEFGEEDMKMNVMYINLPIMFKYYVMEKLSINLGPQLGYAVSAKAKVGSVKSDIDGVKKFDVALGIGATYDLGVVFVDARYNYGLTKVTEAGKVKNGVIQIGVGYKF